MMSMQNTGRMGHLNQNDQSFIWLIQALRNRLGTDKLITLYNIGPAAENSMYNENVSKTIDYSWNPYYGSWRFLTLLEWGPTV